MVHPLLLTKHKGVIYLRHAASFQLQPICIHCMIYNYEGHNCSYTRDEIKSVSPPLLLEKMKTTSSYKEGHIATYKLSAVKVCWVREILKFRMMSDTKVHCLLCYIF